MMDDREGGGGGINSLPDSMLHHVLSFLTMKQAIQTSLISKRWSCLWVSIPTFNFTRFEGKEKEKEKEKAFMEFVDTVLILHDNSCNIQRFSITDVKNTCSEFVSDSFSLRLNIWIRSAVRRNLKEIHLEIYFGERVKLPHCLFTCNSLRKLKLISLGRRPTELILPVHYSTISLPQLQSLHFDGFTLHNQDDFKINHFLSNCCLGLESLTLNKCQILAKNLNIVAPNLMHLVIHEVDLYTQQFLKHGEATGSVRLYAPNLISFHCKDYLSKRYYLENVSSLVEAYIDMNVRAREMKEAGVQKKGRNAMINGEKIDFGILHNVKHLWLSPWALQIFIATYGSSDSASTEFHNLRSMELETWLSGDCICGITCLLHISPNIVKLSLKIIEPFHCDQDTVTTVFPHWDEIILNPTDIGDYLKLPLRCMLDHLKIVEIRGLKGTINELKFLEVLLKNAVVLEELIMGFSLCYLREHRERRLIKYSKILQSFPRASSSIFKATYGSSDSASIEFHNLRSLELETWLSGDCICGITCLLHISPNIVKLSLKIIEDTVTPVFPHWDEIKLNPAELGDYLKLPLHCMLDHLKIVEIRGLMGTVYELKFLEVLLKNAVVLKELNVVFSPDYLKGKCFKKRQLIKYSKNLQSLPRASSNVSILLIS